MSIGLKNIVSVMALVLVLPLYLVFSILSLFTDPNAIFTAHVQFLSMIPGKTGNYLRNSYFRLTMEDCQSGVVISFGTLFSQRDTEIGSGTYIGPQCNIGSCRIGQDCLLGSGVHVLSGKNQHTFDRLDLPIRDQGGVIAKISIGNDCWIGNGAVVMADVGNQVVVAAGAVVTNPVPARTIVAGNPARVVRDRSTQKVT